GTGWADAGEGDGECDRLASRRGRRTRGKYRRGGGTFRRQHLACLRHPERRVAAKEIDIAGSGPPCNDLLNPCAAGAIADGAGTGGNKAASFRSNFVPWLAIFPDDA